MPWRKYCAILNEGHGGPLWEWTVWRYLGKVKKRTLWMLQSWHFWQAEDQGNLVRWGKKKKNQNEKKDEAAIPAESLISALASRSKPVFRPRTCVLWRPLHTWQACTVVTPPVFPNRMCDHLQSSYILGKGEHPDLSRMWNTGSKFTLTARDPKCHIAFPMEKECAGTHNQSGSSPCPPGGHSSSSLKPSILDPWKDTLQGWGGQ